MSDNGSMNMSGIDNQDVQYDDDGNPIDPNVDLGPKVPQNPLTPELLKKCLSKISKTFSKLYYNILI
jgi:hypothetical protein